MFIVNTEDRKSAISEIYNNIQDGDMILDPEYQRNYVYDIKRASKVIESVMLEIPLPAIFVNEEEDNTLEIIDGVQRITSIVKFLNSEYALEGLTILKDFNGKIFKDLTKEEKRAFKQKGLRIIKFRKDCSSEVKFEIFLRLNQGSVKLNNQELRNCLYRGVFNDKLKCLALKDLIIDMIKLTDAQKNRFLIEEYILRGIMFLNQNRLDTKSSLSGSMNNLMEKYKNSELEVTTMIKDYSYIMTTISLILGKNAFRSGLLKAGKFLSVNYDSLLIAFKNFKRDNLIIKKDDVKKAVMDCISSNKYCELTLTSSSSFSKVNERANMIVEAISNVIETNSIKLDKKRFFSPKEKEFLYNDSNVCALCKNTIEDIKDSEVDHIIPWSKGGKTILENAQITHWYCNSKKNNKEEK